MSQDRVWHYKMENGQPKHRLYLPGECPPEWTEGKHKAIQEGTPVELKADTTVMPPVEAKRVIKRRRKRVKKQP